MLFDFEYSIVGGLSWQTQVVSLRFQEVAGKLSHVKFVTTVKELIVIFR